MIEGEVVSACGGFIAMVALVVGSMACAPRETTLPPDTAEPDLFLSERGMEALEMERWLDARTYFQQIIDGYPAESVQA